MSLLANLKDTNFGKKTRKRVGRGPGSQIGKTCRRGQKGQGARSGYKRRYGQEGGQVPLFRKMPTRGFSNARFRKEIAVINLGQIDACFKDGETVNVDSLRQRGWMSGSFQGLKILAEGELTKKVRVEADAYSQAAKAKLDAAGIEYVQLGA